MKVSKSLTKLLPSQDNLYNQIKTASYKRMSKSEKEQLLKSAKKKLQIFKFNKKTGKVDVIV